MALKKGLGKVGTAWMATWSLRLASYVDHQSAIQPLLYGYNTAGLQGSHPLRSLERISVFLRLQLDSPSLPAPPAFI